MSVIEKLDSVLAIRAEWENVPATERRTNEWEGLKLAAARLLRDHGPAIRQAMIDAEKWRRWEPWLRKQNRVPFNLAKDLAARLASEREWLDTPTKPRYNCPTEAHDGEE